MKFLQLITQNLFSKILLILLCLVSLPAWSQNNLEALLLNASPETIQANPELFDYMNNLAEPALADNCTSCHGSVLTGGVGVPNLVDYEWLWGIDGFEMTGVESVMEIMQTILYGVRNTDCDEEIKMFGGCPDTRYSEMPAYAELGFDEASLNNMVDYVLSLSGEDANPFAVEAASSQWPLCVECHGVDGTGYTPFGGPDLTDDIWLFGSSGRDIYDVVANGRVGVCPAWSEVLDAATIKALATYIYYKANGFI
ncbi:MAG: c-type cytochrome [Gammaproteobacteria bacterium]|jgi:cytochrome c oxidase cbb3-type subunit III|nr:c-type cytochrome [Gammaproteobacteria bacterium]